MNLQDGRNDIQFVVTSRIQGTQEVSANIYLWNHDAKIVVSDVDGTITRSDALGHILPMFGQVCTVRCAFCMYLQTGC